VYPDFKDGVFASNQQALEALEQVNMSLARKVYSLAKRQSNGTNTATSAASTTPTPTTVQPPPTTPYVTSSTSTIEQDIVTNGVHSTRTTYTVVVETVTPTNGVSATVSGKPEPTAQLQSFGVRTQSPSFMVLLLVLVGGWVYGSCRVS
jgi:hypothetical protein